MQGECITSLSPPHANEIVVSHVSGQLHVVAPWCESVCTRNPFTDPHLLEPVNVVAGAPGHCRPEKFEQDAVLLHQPSQQQSPQHWSPPRMPSITSATSCSSSVVSPPRGVRAGQKAWGLVVMRMSPALRPLMLPTALRPPVPPPNEQPVWLGSTMTA